MKKFSILTVLMLATLFFVSCGLVDEEDLEDYGDLVDSESGSNNDPTSDTSDNSDQENDQENDNGDTSTDQASENGNTGTDQGNENGDTGTDPNPNPTPTPDPTDPGDNNGNQGGETPGNDTETPDQENETPDQDTETPDSDTGSGDNGNETFEDENDTYDYEKCTEITLKTELNYDTAFDTTLVGIDHEFYYAFSASSNKDSLNVEFYDLDDFNGTYNLRGKDYSSYSGLFLVFFENSGTKKYIQRKGTVIVTSSKYDLTTELYGVALEEVTIDKNTHATTVVPDGACITIVDTTLTF